MDDSNHAGHRQRLRERFQRAGLLALNDYERLELLLTYALPRRDVKPIAKALLARHGSLASVLDAPVDSLAAADGMGESSAIMLHLVRELCHAYFAERMADAPALAPATERRAPASSAGSGSAVAGPAALPKQPALQAPGATFRSDPPARPAAPLTTSQTVLDYARVRLGGVDREHLLAIFLDAGHRVLGQSILQEGVHNRVAVYPRQIVEAALQQRAVGIILVHNHPSGLASPSPDDIAMTAAVANAAALLGLELVDHLIVAGGAAFSFADSGLL